MSERIFHCTAEGAYKFWQVSVEGMVQTVRYGPIGAEGQVVTKSFESAEAANTATEKIIAQKLAKGYVPVTPEQAAKTLPKRRRTYTQLLLPFDEPASPSVFSGTLLPPEKVAPEPVALSLF